MREKYGADVKLTCKFIASNDKLSQLSVQSEKTLCVTILGDKFVQLSVENITIEYGYVASYEKLSENKLLITFNEADVAKRFFTEMNGVELDEGVVCRVEFVKC